MAGQVALSQALSYARDLRRAYEAAHAREAELVHAHERLRGAYQQSLQYAIDLKKTYRRLQRAIFQSLLGLANALEAKDPYTRGHSTRVAALSRDLALRMGLHHEAAEIISQAALLHDLGKIGVPEGILRKPGPLSGEEWEIMRRHPLTGAQIVAPLEFFDEGAIIVRHHHERLDGSGYPDGLAGDGIPLGARIVAVADVYDALTSARPYRDALPHADAAAALRREAGRTLDDDLVTLLVDVLENPGPGDSDPGRVPAAQPAPYDPPE
jgi:putative nucleotidyltransferase with HDIG domain